MSLFRHIDGRIMKRTPAGGTGGGVTSHFDELASAEEAAEFKREEGLDEEPEPLPEGEPGTHQDIETKHYSDGTSATGPGPLPDLSPEQQASAERHGDGEIRPSEAAPNA